jgi:hypothetical protein
MVDSSCSPGVSGRQINSMHWQAVAVHRVRGAVICRMCWLLSGGSLMCHSIVVGGRTWWYYCHLKCLLIVSKLHSKDYCMDT